MRHESCKPLRIIAEVKERRGSPGFSSQSSIRIMPVGSTVQMLESNISSFLSHHLAFDFSWDLFHVLGFWFLEHGQEVELMMKGNYLL